MYDRLAKGKELGLQSGKAKWNARPVRIPKANGEAGLGRRYWLVATRQGIEGEESFIVFVYSEFCSFLNVYKLIFANSS